MKRFAKGDNRDYAPIFPIKIPLKLSDTLDSLTSLDREDSRELAPKHIKELLVKLMEILDRLRRLLIRFKRDFASESPIHIYCRLRKTL